MSVALPVIPFRHFGQSCRGRLDLHVSQRWCPLLHWKILVGGTISSKQTGHSGADGRVFVLAWSTFSSLVSSWSDFLFLVTIPFSFCFVATATSRASIVSSFPLRRRARLSSL